MPKTLGCENQFNQVCKWLHVLERWCGGVEDWYKKKRREKNKTMVGGESLDWAKLIKREI